MNHVYLAAGDIVASANQMSIRYVRDLWSSPTITSLHGRRTIRLIHRKMASYMHSKLEYLVEVNGYEVGPTVSWCIVASVHHALKRPWIVLARGDEIRHVPEIVHQNQRPRRCVHCSWLSTVLARTLFHPLFPICNSLAASEQWNLSQWIEKN